jgi:hypothetical protein
MFDFLNHWFSKTINKGGKQLTKFKSGHYSLDLTFIVIIIILLIIIFSYYKFKKYCLNKQKQVIQKDFQLIPLNNHVV